MPSTVARDLRADTRPSDQRFGCGCSTNADSCRGEMPTATLLPLEKTCLRRSPEQGRYLEFGYMKTSTDKPNRERAL